MTDSAKLADYILGRLPPEEASVIEEQYLADPALHDELRAVERELIDQYVHGELDNKEEFERLFLTSPARRQRVEFARALDRSMARTAQSSGGEILPGRSNRSGAWHRGVGNDARTWPAVAATLVLLAAGWLLVSRLPGQPRNPAVPVLPNEAASPSIPANQDAERTPPGERANSGRLATLVLATNLTRSSGETPTVTVDSTTAVRLEAHLETSEYARYSATIQTGDGQELWRQEPLSPAPTADGTVVIVTIPPGRLVADEYVLRVNGLATGGAVDLIAGYTFRVRAP